MSTGHQNTKLLLAGIVTDDIHDFALVHDSDTVGERADFVQFGGYQQHRFSGVALLDQATVNKLDSADIHTASRLCRDERHRVTGKFACNNNLLLIPT